MSNYLPDDLSNEMIAWLPWGDPDDWHRVALTWNWDAGDDVLRWIVRQPECDRATALMIFWLGEPTYYWNDLPEKVSSRLADKSEINGPFGLLGEIVARWNTTGFSRSELAYDPQRERGARPEHVELSSTHPTLAISRDMIDPVAGRTLPQDEDFIDGFPPHIGR